MEFKAILLQAKAGDEEAMRELLKLYQPQLRRYSFYMGRFDEDLYQELCITLLQCVKKFVIQ